MDGLTVAVLGPLDVSVDGTPVPITAGRERAVVEALALRADQPVRVSKLVDALWGERPPATALKTLQNYVARLRRVLPDGVLVSDRDGYRLAVAPDAIDAVRFERDVADASEALAIGAAADAAELLASALALWRGDALPDLAERAEAVRLEELRRSAEEHLAEAWLRLGIDSEAIADLQAAVLREPLRERRWAQLITALYRAGRQADALRTYRRARAILVETFGVEPGPELRRLERAVLDHDEALSHPASAERAVDAELPPAVAALSASPIAGRDGELAALAKRWAEAAEGVARIDVISGEAGIGKTRLVAEAARTAHDQGALVLFGRCDAEPGLPYQPFVEAFRWLISSQPLRSLQALPRWEAAELARLVPDLNRRLAAPPLPPTADPADRSRLFDAAVALVRRQARRRPVLLALDDLQWADPATVLLLTQLLRAAASDRLHVVAAHRSRDPGADPALSQLLAALPRESDPRHVALSGIDADAIAGLLGADRQVGEAVWSSTRGSPLFVAEFVLHQRASGRSAASGDLPAGLRQAVERRLGGLTDTDRRLLDAAAVAGTAFELAVAAGAAGLAGDGAIDLVDDARRLNVVDEDPTRPGWFAFAHDVVRSVLYDTMLPSRRTQLHRRVGLAVAAHHRHDIDDHIGAIAHHLVIAAAGRPDIDAVDWSTRAGQRALDQLAWEVATGHFADAIRLLPSSADRQRHELLLLLARAQRAAGMATEAKKRFLDAIDAARRAGEPVWLAEAVVEYAEVPVDVRRELRDIIGLLEEALAGIGEGAGDDRLRARLQARLAFSMAWANDPRARQTSESAIELARRTGDPLTRAQSLAWSVPTRMPLTAATGSWLTELSDLAGEVDDPTIRLWTLNQQWVCAVQHADPAAARAALARLCMSADELRLPDHRYRARKAEGDWWLIAGRVADVERRVDEMLADAARTDVRNLFLFAGALLYDLRRWQGRLAALAPWFDDVAARGERLALVPAMHVEVLVAAGRGEQAREALDRYVAVDFADVWPVEQAHSFATLAGCAAALDHRDAAMALRARLEPWAGLVVYDGTGGVLGAVDHHLGLLSTTLNEPELALEQLAGGRRLHKRLGSPPLVAVSDEAIGRLTDPSGTAPARR